MTALVTTLTAMMAYAFARFEFRGKNLIFYTILAMMMVPAMMFIIPQFMVARTLSLLDSLPGLVLVYTSGAMAFNTFLLRGFFESLPRELEESALMDGANHFTIFTRIIVPLSTPALSTVAVFSFLGAWDEYIWALTVITDAEKRTLPVAIANFRGVHATDWGLIFAASLVAVVPTIIIFVLFQRYFVQGVDLRSDQGMTPVRVRPVRIRPVRVRPAWRWLASALLAVAASAMPLATATHGGTALAQEPVFDAAPDRAFYRPGEPVMLHVTAEGGAQVEATITHLAAAVTTLRAPLDGGAAAALTWTPPAVAPRGYGVDLRLLDADGATLATTSTAFDVLERWMQAPRYGFLSEFGPGRDDIAETMAWCARYHINGLQFYDWQYRHEALMPPEPLYTDVLGRRLSLDTVTQLIAAAHARNIAAMPYTAVYGASPAFYAQHKDWALFQRPDHPYEFGGGFLYIMDPTPGAPWATHLLAAFAQVLDETAFDGIHLDQYGAPTVGRNAAGERVDLAAAFPAFIDETARVVRAARGDDGAVIFNAVGNWPVETVAPADQDAVYIEVWPPYTGFMDLHRLVANAEALGGGKPVIIAAYIPPRQFANVRLADALIFASGGYHLELGEPGAMLADPYFPGSA
ncbi:MAG: ABC transporter permease subunit [Anaerolineae bacterium]|nr:ABC transporter permease subunit [Anaerolineae bacterium]